MSGRPASTFAVPLDEDHDGRALLGRKAFNMARHVAAICHAHLLAGHEPPTRSEIVRGRLRGIRIRSH